MADESQRRQFIEEPKLEHLSEETVKNPPKQRTVQQQEKQDKLIKQERREAGIDTARSRSSSRRERRKRIKQAFEDGSHMKTGSLEALEEADANGDMSAMRPFERIGPDSTSMDGPVTMARAMRGEIPMRGSNPSQPYYMTPEPQKGVRYTSFIPHRKETPSVLTLILVRTQRPRRPQIDPRSEPRHRNRTQSQHPRRLDPLIIVSTHITFTPYCQFLPWEERNACTKKPRKPTIPKHLSPQFAPRWTRLLPRITVPSE